MSNNLVFTVGSLLQLNISEFTLSIETNDRQIMLQNSNISVKCAFLSDTSTTVVPSKNDSGVIFCLQLISKIFTCTLHLT